MNTLRKALTVGMVEDDNTFRAALEQQIRAEVTVRAVRAWESAEDFLGASEKDRNVDLLFLDLGLPGRSGLDLLASLDSADLEFPVVILSSLNSDETVFNALKNGASGYIQKSELERIGEVIASVLDGGAVISPTIALRVLHSFRKPAEKELNLTPRETEVLSKLVTGMTAREAAQVLFISEHTLRIHVKHIYRKLSVRNKAEMMVKAKDLGFF